MKFAVASRRMLSDAATSLGRARETLRIGELSATPDNRPVKAVVQNPYEDTACASRDIGEVAET
jgi:hypothetical protein